MRYLKTIATALAMGVMVLALSAKAESPRVGDRFGDWTFECNAVAQGKTDCALTQMLVDAQRNNAAVAKFSLSRDPESGDRYLIAAIPLGIDFLQPIAARVDDAEPIGMQMLTCVQTGCIARLKLTPELVGALKAGKTMGLTIKYVSAPKPVVFGMSLIGLADGIPAAGLE